MNNLDRPTSSECSICFTEFNHPKQIPCLHSFCLKCLIHYCQGKSEGDVIPCPLCRREVRIPTGGVEKFNDDVDIVQPPQNQSERICELCPEAHEDIKAESFCQNCDQFLCSGCKIRHLKQNVSKLHNIVSIADKLKEGAMQRIKFDYCAVHENEEFKLYCYDCLKMLCKICHATDHYTHKCQVLTLVVIEKRSLANQYIETLEKRRNQVLGTMKALDQAKADCVALMSESNETIAVIISACSEFQEYHVRYLHAKLGEIFSLKEKEIESKREMVRLLYEELDSSINKSKTVLKIGADGEIIEITDVLHNEAKSMSTTQGVQESILSAERGAETSQNLTDEILEDKMGKLLYIIKIGQSSLRDLVNALAVNNHAEAMANSKKILQQLNSDVEIVKEESFKVAPQLVTDQETYQNLITLRENMKSELEGLRSELSECKVKLVNQETTMIQHYTKLEGVAVDRDQLKEKVCTLTKISDKQTEEHTRLKSSFGSSQENLHLSFMGNPFNPNWHNATKIFSEFVVRILIVVGLDTGDSVEPKICHINLDRPDTISVINSTPFKIYNESGACVIDNAMYIVGVGTYRNELWKRIPEKDEWKKLAFLPAGRRGHCTTFVGDKIYVLGGYNDYEKRTLDSVLRYDIISNTWTQVTQLCNAVRYAACVTYKHFLYVFGGLGQDDKNVNYVQIYNTLTSEITLGSKPIPRIQAYVRAVLWETKVLLIAPFTCYIYDIELNTWEERCRFNSGGLFHFGLTINDDTIYISGGGSSRQVPNTLNWPIRYDLSPKEIWTCTDEVKCLPVNDLISNFPHNPLESNQSAWKHHAKLPRPALVHSFTSQPTYRYI